MIDFLLLYEHKARELENCVYLTEALRESGHTVKICSMLSFKKMLYKPKVIVVPHLYDSNQARYYTSSIWKNNRPRVISMQYEQVLNIAGRKTQLHRPKGIAKKAFHVAWGKNERMEYLDNQIPSNKILEIGSISMDFDSDAFSAFLPAREAMAKEFGLPVDKKWCIFFSSFAYCGRSDENLDRMPIKEAAYRLRDIMEKTKPVILNWFEDALTKYPDIIFIYRRHPAENVGRTLEAMKTKYPDRFFEINQHSIRPWIKVTDYCFTWFSTSCIDAYFAGKPCIVLRPYPLDKDLEVEVMYNLDFITNKDGFINTFSSDIKDTEGLKSNIERFFINQRNKLQIDEYVHSFVSVLKDEDPNDCFVVHKESIRSEIVEILMGLICDVCKYFRISPLFKPFSLRLYNTVSYYEKEVYGVNKEINNLTSVINIFLKTRK